MWFKACGQAGGNGLLLSTACPQANTVHSPMLGENEGGIWSSKVSDRHAFLEANGQLVEDAWPVVERFGPFPGGILINEKE